MLHLTMVSVMCLLLELELDQELFSSNVGFGEGDQSHDWRGIYR